MIAEITDGRLTAYQTLTEALPFDGRKPPRVAAVGAGGKTTLLKALALEYSALGDKPVIITTTHMKNENTSQFLVDPSIEGIREALEQESFIFAGARAENEKIKILPPEILKAVLELPYPILIEADGARRLPMKIPAEYEPVLLPQITCVLSVYGLDALGKRLREVCFRAEQAAGFLHKSVEDKVEAKDIASLALSGQGGRKDISDTMQYVIVLNKADTEERRKQALEIGRYIEIEKEEHGIQEVKIITASRQAP